MLVIRNYHLTPVMMSIHNGRANENLAFNILFVFERHDYCSGKQVKVASSLLTCALKYQQFDQLGGNQSQYWLTGNT